MSNTQNTTAPISSITKQDIADTREFMKNVLPDMSVYCTAHVPPGKASPSAVTMYDTVSDMLRGFYTINLHKKLEAFYAYGGFNTGTKKRLKKNISYVKALVLDLDVRPGEKKSFASMEEARNAIAALTRQLPITPTYVVNTGGGFHIYWCLETPVSVEQHGDMANTLVHALRAYDMRFLKDTRITRNSAGLIRVPNSFSVKRNVVVRIDKELSSGLPIKQEDFAVLAGAPNETTATPNSSASATFTSHVMPPRPAHIPAKAAASNILVVEPVSPLAVDVPTLLNNCAVARYAMDNQTDVSRDLWWKTIQLCTRAVDGEKWAHEFSKQDPSRYDPAEVDRKFAEDTRNWQSAPEFAGLKCETYAEAATGDRSMCKGCAFYKSNAGSPIHASVPKPAAPVAANVPMTLSTAPTLGKTLESDCKSVAFSLFDMSMHAVPDYLPFNDPEAAFFINDNYALMWSGMSRRSVATPAQKKSYIGDLEIANPAFWPVQYVGQQVEIAFFSRGKIRTCSVDLRIWNTPHLLRQQLALNKVMLNILPSESTGLALYIQQCSRHMGGFDDSGVASHFGWQDLPIKDSDDTEPAFLIGEYRVDKGRKVNKVPITGSAASLNSRIKMAPKGEFKKAKQLLNVYANTAPLWARTMLMLSLGAPLMRMTGENGVIVHFSGKGGVGKTAVLSLATSMWASPSASALTTGDTAKGMLNAVGGMHSLPVSFDEITLYPREKLQELAYAMSTARTHNKSTVSGALQTSVDQWQTILISTGNNSLLHTIGAQSTASQAQSARVLEIDVDALPSLRLPSPQLVALSDLPHKHYGWLGMAFMSHVVDNYDAVEKEVRNTFGVMRQHMGSSDQRFRAAALACAIVANRIASNALGIKSFGLSKDTFNDIIKRNVTLDKRADRVRANVVQSMLARFSGRFNKVQMTPNGWASVSPPPLDSAVMGRIEYDNSLKVSVIYVAEHSIRRVEEELGLNNGEFLSMCHANDKIVQNPNAKTDDKSMWYVDMFEGTEVINTANGQRILHSTGATLAYRVTL